MVTPRLAAMAALALAAAAARGEPSSRDAGRGSAPDAGGNGPSGCRLQQPGADAVTTRDCLRCHAAAGRHDHPVDVDYEGARSSRGSFLRPLAEVVRRGVLVPGGEVRCVTCHDGRSPWKYRIALPPGAEARPAADPRDHATHQGGPTTAAPLQPGAEVTARPLCLACHAFD